MSIYLETRFTATDETACGRCGSPTTFGESAPWGDADRICLVCISLSAERQLLSRAAGPISR